MKKPSHSQDQLDLEIPDIISNLPTSSSYSIGISGTNLASSPSFDDFVPKQSITLSDDSYELLSKESSDAYSNQPKSAGINDAGRVFPGIRRDSRPAIVPWEFQGGPIPKSDSKDSTASSDHQKKDKGYVPMPMGRTRAKSGSSASGSSDSRRTSIFWRLGNSNNEAKLKVTFDN